MSYSACDFMDEITDVLTHYGTLPADAFADEDAGNMGITGDICCTAIRELAAQRDAARAMLAALKDATATTRLVNEDPAERLDQIMGVLDEAIAQAEAAGIGAPT